jgi:hypothetical protein
VNMTLEVESKKTMPPLSGMITFMSWRFIDCFHVSSIPSSARSSLAA